MNVQGQKKGKQMNEEKRLKRILKHPLTARVSCLWWRQDQLIPLLGNALTAGNFAMVSRYLKRCPQRIQAGVLKAALRRDPTIAQCPAFLRWVKGDYAVPASHVFWAKRMYVAMLLDIEQTGQTGKNSQHYASVVNSPEFIAWSCGPEGEAYIKRANKPLHDLLALMERMARYVEQKMEAGNE